LPASQGKVYVGAADIQNVTAPVTVLVDNVAIDVTP
jgi:hypothetical protein